MASGIKKTQEKFVEEMSVKHPELEVIGEYKNKDSKVKCKCLKCGHIFESSAGSMLYGGNSCPKCAVKKKNEKYSKNSRRICRRS